MSRRTHRALILRAGDAVAPVAARHGQFATWIHRTVGPAWPHAWHEHDARADAPLPEPAGYDAIVLTGSSASVTAREPWMLRAEAWLRAAHVAGTPTFGICFGHQLIGQAFGGEVRKNPRGREIGTVELTRHDGDPLFAGLPERFDINATHVDTVAVLPPGARVLASTALEPNAVMALGDRIRGVQFHPEFDGELMRGYVSARREAMLSEGLDADEIGQRAKDTPENGSILRNFFRQIVQP